MKNLNILHKAKPYNSVKAIFKRHKKPYKALNKSIITQTLRALQHKKTKPSNLEKS